MRHRAAGPWWCSPLQPSQPQPPPRPARFVMPPLRSRNSMSSSGSLLPVLVGHFDILTPDLVAYRFSSFGFFFPDRHFLYHSRGLFHYRHFLSLSHLDSTFLESMARGCHIRRTASLDCDAFSMERDISLNGRLHHITSDFACFRGPQSFCRFQCSFGERDYLLFLGCGWSFGRVARMPAAVVVWTLPVTGEGRETRASSLPAADNASTDFSVFSSISMG